MIPRLTSTAGTNRPPGPSNGQRGSEPERSGAVSLSVSGRPAKLVLTDAPSPRPVACVPTAPVRTAQLSAAAAAFRSRTKSWNFSVRWSCGVRGTAEGAP